MEVILLAKRLFEGTIQSWKRAHFRNPERKCVIWQHSRKTTQFWRLTKKPSLTVKNERSGRCVQTSCSSAMAACRAANRIHWVDVPWRNTRAVAKTPQTYKKEAFSEQLHNFSKENRYFKRKVGMLQQCHASTFLEWTRHQHNGREVTSSSVLVPSLPFSESWERIHFECLDKGQPVNADVHQVQLQRVMTTWRQNTQEFILKMGLRSILMTMRIVLMDSFSSKVSKTKHLIGSLIHSGSYITFRDCYLGSCNQM